jgi:dimethylhistidine N-methyltransferase
VQLLGALARPVAYLPVDIAPEWLEAAASRVAQAFPGLPVRPVVADFTQPFALAGRAEGSATHLGFFPGSTIGNFVPAEAVSFLRRARTTLRAGARMLLGADLVKDPAVLEAAYDDAAGVTAAFNLNLLRHLNRLLGADFDPRDWRHMALFNPALSRVEMHLEARRALTVCWPGGQRHFEDGERIHTENAFKYSVEGFTALLQHAGFEAPTHWTDPQAAFAVFWAPSKRSGR